jgi:hypothetical protein
MQTYKIENIKLKNNGSKLLQLFDKTILASQGP